MAGLMATILSSAEHTTTWVAVPLHLDERRSLASQLVTLCHRRSPGARAQSRSISSPNLGVFAVTAADPGPRLGHIIYSGVFAVAAVTAAGVISGPLRLAGRGPLRAPRPRWPAPVGGWRCRGRGRGRLELGGPSVPVTGAALIVRSRHRLGLRGSSGGGGRPCRAATEALGQRLDTDRAADHPPAAGIAPRPASRALGLRWRTTRSGARRASMTSMMARRVAAAATCLRRRKCPPTRHCLQTTSDNRRSAWLPVRS